MTVYEAKVMETISFRLGSKFVRMEPVGRFIEVEKDVYDSLVENPYSYLVETREYEVESEPKDLILSSGVPKILPTEDVLSSTIIKPETVIVPDTLDNILDAAHNQATKEGNTVVNRDSALYIDVSKPTEPVVPHVRKPASKPNPKPTNMIGKKITQVTLEEMRKAKEQGLILNARGVFEPDRKRK